MSKIFVLGSALAFCLLGATGASARDDVRARPCAGCGPIAPLHITRTIHPSLYVTRYHDRSVTDRVMRVRHVFVETRIQPIIHVHDVTRVHHLTLVSADEAYAYPVQPWPPVSFLQQGIMQPGAGIANGCSCGGDE